VAVDLAGVEQQFGAAQRIARNERLQTNEERRQSQSEGAKKISPLTRGLKQDRGQPQPQDGP
jgi:hypothetical protein